MTAIERAPVFPAPSASAEVRVIPRVPVPRYEWRRYGRLVRAVVVVGLLVLLLARGLVATFAAPPGVTRVVEQVDGRDLVGEAYAAKVARVALTYDVSDPAGRAVQVALVAPGAGMLGWDGSGRSSVSDVAVVGSQNVSGIVWFQVLVVANGEPRTVLVPVARDVSGRPLLAGSVALGSAVTNAPAQQGVRLGAGDVDQVATDAARPIVEGFLRAWGAGDLDLAAYVADGWTAPPGPGGMRLAVAPSIRVGSGTPRVAVVAVRWIDQAGRTYPSGYALALTQTGARWAVAGIVPTPLDSADIPVGKVAP